MNRILLSNDEKWVEYWNNGSLVYSVFIRCWLADAVGQARDYCRKWSGEEPELSTDLINRLLATDALITKMTYGK